MKINLSRLLLDRQDYNIEINNSVNISCIESKRGNIFLKEPLKIKGNIYKVDNDLFLDAKLVYTYNETCSRCLKEFYNTIETRLYGKLLEKNRNSFNLNIEEDKEEPTIFYDGNNLDLLKAIEDAVILSLPMKPLCDENCKGLCPICGKNLNDGECDCNIDDIDPRLAKLKELFD